MTNQTFLKIIKAQLEGAKGTWPDELPNVLWAYRTTTRTPTGETPFNLIYDTKALIPVKTGVVNMRREFFHEEGNDNHLKLNLDCLDEVRDKASPKNGKVPAKDGQLLQPKSEDQKTYHRRPRLTKGHTRNGRFNISQTRTNMGRALQDRPLFKTRKLPPGVNGW